VHRCFPTRPSIQCLPWPTLLPIQRCIHHPHLSSPLAAVPRFSISHQSIRDTGARELARMLARNQSLTDFRMENGKVTFRGILGIAEVLRRNLAKLRLLNVRGHRCTTEFACLIGVALAGSSTLEALHFGPFHSIPVQRISGRARTGPYALDLSALGSVIARGCKAMAGVESSRRVPLRVCLLGCLFQT
jgi:hypothetical protein